MTGGNIASRNPPAPDGALMRPSRRPRSLSSGRPEAGPGGGLLIRMTYVYDGINKERHPEETAERASRRTHRAIFSRLARARASAAPPLLNRRPRGPPARR